MAAIGRLPALRALETIVAFPKILVELDGIFGYALLPATAPTRD
jgi:hypothetical protein